MTFNKKKAIETILYLTDKISAPDVYAICKMIYLADKYSLSNYGRFIFGDTYSAMLEGGTPSHAYDLLKDARKREINGIKVNGNDIVASRKPNLDNLSESDIESLNKVVAKYENSRPIMRDDAHDEAWKKNWDNRSKDRESTIIPIEDIAKLFPDSEDLISYLANCD
jgi:uncharacterized phage-associated protein